VGDIELTERAVEVLVRARTAAVRFDPGVKIRVGHDATGSVVFQLVDDAQEGDSTVDLGDGATVLVESGLMGVVDAGEHDALVLRQSPAPEQPN
jgi:hypothetical protein